MKTNVINPDSSWLNGIRTVNNHRTEINTRMPYIAIDGHRIEFFAQGEDASVFIDEIHNNWVTNESKTIEDCISDFMSNLY